MIKISSAYVCDVCVFMLHAGVLVVKRYHSPFNEQPTGGLKEKFQQLREADALKQVRIGEAYSPPLLQIL